MIQNNIQVCFLNNTLLRSYKYLKSLWGMQQNLKSILNPYVSILLLDCPAA